MESTDTSRDPPISSAPERQPDGASASAERMTSVDTFIVQQLKKARRKDERRFQEMIDALPEAIYTTDADGHLTYFNPAAVEFSGREPELGSDRWCVTWALYHPDGTPMPHHESPMAVALKEGRSIRGAKGIAERPDGERVWFEAYPSPLRDDDGRVVGAINMLVDVTERKRTERLQEEQNRLLELIASGTPLEECLSALCEVVPELNSGTRASILLADDERDQFTKNIAPDLASSFGDGLEGAPINDLMIGTCGEAVFSGEPISCEDVANDDRWSNEWRDLCVAHGVLAGYSVPIRNEDGEPQGSFMLCFDEPRAPSEWEQRLADFGTRVASIALERDRSRQALREREEHLSALVETTPDCIKVVAEDGTLLQMNPAGLEIADADSASDMIGKCIYDFIAPEDRQRYREFNERICRGERGTLEFDVINLAGTRRHLESHSAPLQLSNGEVVQVALTRDVTKRKRDEEALRNSENRLRLATDAAELGVFKWDIPNDQVTWENDRMYEIFRQNPDEEPINAATFSNEVVHPDDAEAFETAIDDALQTDRFHFVGRFRRRDGELRWIELTGQIQRGPDGTPVRMPGIAADITERKETEEALRELNETLEERVERRTAQVRELTSRLSMAEHKERRRIAQVLHDDLQQRLYGIQLKMSSLRKDVRSREQDADEQESISRQIEGLEGRMEEAIQSMRELSVSMSPPVLKSEGLAASIEWLQSQMKERHGLDVALSADREFRMEENEDMRVLLFRIIRELLFNVVKHAGTSRATVELREADGDLIVRVIDRGKGFEPDELEKEGPEEAFGLAGARDRIRPFGGELQIESTPGTGTCVTVRVPLA